MNLPKTGSILRRLLIIIPAAVGLILVTLFMPAQRLTIEGIGMLSFETTVTLSIGYEVAHASPGYYDVVSALNPDFWWKLDGNENDSADSANSDGGNDPDWVSSIIPAITSTNQCGDYNGSNDETDIPNQTKINSSTTYEKSISVWIYADTLDSTGRIIWAEGGSSNGLSLHVKTGTLYFNVYESSNRDTLSTSISTGTLYHIGATLDCNAGEMYLYINGSQVDSKTGGLNIASSFNSHAAGIAIGGADSTMKDENGSNMSGVFNGRIADVAYWGEQDVLSESDFDSIYTEGVGAAEPDISNDPDSKDFGNVAENSSYWSYGSAPTWPLNDTECYFTVTNNGSSAVNISIRATNFTGGVGWTLVTGVPGLNEARLTVWEDGDGEGDGINLTTSDSGFISNLAGTSSKKWELRLTTGTFSDGVGKSSTITLTATSA